ncbi:MAG: MATE family efflux transporter [Myxococcales bacterium]|nr:MATE family efflux transporter [Myxococcales bacterium]
MRTLLALAAPVVLARATQSVVGFTDAYMVAPLGEDALTATTGGAINSFSLVILPMGTAFIIQSFVAQLVGKGRAADARRYAWYGLALALAAGVLALAALPLIGPVLGWFPHTPHVRGLMTDYMMIRLTAVAAIVGSEALGNWFGGFSNTSMQMRAGILTMVINVAGNWLLIEGRAGAPAMGVQGAALASAISSWIGLGYLFFEFRRAPRHGAAPTAWSWPELGRVLRFGLPNGFNWFLEFGAFALFLNVAVAQLGTAAYGALNVIIQVNSVAFMPAFGIATAGAILAGQSIGAGAFDAVHRVVRMTLAVTAGWMGLIGLVYLVFPETVMGLFAHDDAKTGVSASQLVAVGAPMLAISSAWQLFDAASMTMSETLRAAGDTAWTLWARVVLAWVVFVPASFVVVYVLDGGTTAVMLCLVAYLAALAVAMTLRFRSGRWRTIDLTGREPELV